MSSLTKSFIFIAFASFSLILAPSPLYAQARERMVSVNDNGILFRVKTNKERVRELLLELDIKLNPRDMVFPGLDYALGDKVFIKRAVPVIIKADGREREVFTFQENVADLLEENRIELKEEDKINYSLNQTLFSKIEVVVTRVEKKRIKVKKEIEFDLQTKRDPNLLWGKQRIIQSGKKGLKEEEYLIIYEDGREAERILQRTKILKEAQPQIVVLGAKIVKGRREEGKASFVKSGVYQGLVAAHKSWPLGSRVKVVNLENGKSVVVKIIDRGPFIKDRVIDLSYLAFEKIASLGQGVIPVRIEEILN